MKPNNYRLLYCIMRDGDIVDGAHGLAIDETKDAAWPRAIDPCEDWSIRKAEEYGMYARTCGITPA